MTGRPPKKPTKAQREQVQQLKADGWSNDRIARLLRMARNTLEKHFAEELEFGADVELAKRLELAHKAAKKLNMTAIKWLEERDVLARAREQLERRAQAQDEPPEQPARPPKLGKKEQQQQAATEVTGKFAPPAGPSKSVH